MSLFTQTKGLHLGKCFALFVCNSSSHSSLGSQWHNLAGSIAWTPVFAVDCWKQWEGKWDAQFMSVAWCLDGTWGNEACRHLGCDPFPWVVEMQCLGGWGLSGDTYKGRTDQGCVSISVPGIKLSHLFLTAIWYSRCSAEKTKAQRPTQLVKMPEPVAKVWALVCLTIKPMLIFHHIVDLALISLLPYWYPCYSGIFPQHLA